MKLPLIMGLVALAAVLDVGMYVTDFTAYLGNNPTTSNNCHVMDAVYESWFHGGHREWATCADCHMPYTRDGAAKYSNHNVHSPLLNAEAACGTCHTDVSYITTRVAMIQAQVYATLINTEDVLLAAISEIKIASETSGVDETLLAQAREFHREAQMYWDLIAAENSMGFHNPEYVLTSLYHATDVARQAQLAALKALP